MNELAVISQAEFRKYLIERERGGYELGPENEVELSFALNGYVHISHHNDKVYVGIKPFRDTPESVASTSLYVGGNTPVDGRDERYVQQEHVIHNRDGLFVVPMSTEVVWVQIPQAGVAVRAHGDAEGVGADILVIGFEHEPMNPIFVTWKELDYAALYWTAHDMLGQVVTDAHRIRKELMERYGRSAVGDPRVERILSKAIEAADDASTALTHFEAEEEL